MRFWAWSGKRSGKKLSKKKQIEVLSDYAIRGWKNYYAALVLLREKNIELEQLKHPPVKPFSDTPLYYTEAQEDIAWAEAMKLVSAETATQILKELDFENTQIYLDDSIEA